MQIPILIEPIEGGGFRARAGEPFAASAEASSADEAVRALESALAQRFQNGSRIAAIEAPNGARPAFVPAPPMTPKDQAFFDSFQMEIERNRRIEAERDVREEAGALPWPFGFVPVAQDNPVFLAMQAEIARLRREEDGGTP